MKRRPVDSKAKHHKVRGGVKKVDNTKDIHLILSKNKVVQDLLGFSNENITRMFEQAVGYLQMGHFDEAILSFSLLTRLNPYIGDFWLGLGIAQLRSGELQRSFDALSMALAMDPLRAEVYTSLIECCLEMKKYALAQLLLDDAVSFAKRHKKSGDALQILEEAKALQEQIVHQSK